jgi:membrane protease subunit (stomatin/prohibitin family)
MGADEGYDEGSFQVFMRRRRPLAAAAMVGGASYLGARAGQNAAMNKQNEQAMEDDQSARIAQLEQQQYVQQQAAPAAPAAPAQSEMTTKLVELKNLHDQGVLTDDEFSAAKQKLIAEA